MQLVNIVVRLLNIEETKPEQRVLSCSFVYRFLICFFAFSLVLSLFPSLFHSLPRSFSHSLTCSAEAPLVRLTSA